MTVKKRKALELMLEQGLARDGHEALSRILAGEVCCGAQRVQSAGQLLPAGAQLHVRGADMPYLSKGGLKLRGALRDFGVDARGRVCIDAGASTGGFTDCLLKAGAARVYAVDVGYGQLLGALRQDARVVNLEKTNISDPCLLALSPRPTLGTVDLSYLSLRLGVPAFAAILGGEGELICLVKPLFETDDTQARRSGMLPDTAYEPLLLSLIDDLNALPGTRVLRATHSPVTGNGGTREFFLHVLLSPAPPPAADLTAPVRAAVGRALALDDYEKKK